MSAVGMPEQVGFQIYGLHAVRRDRTRFIVRCGDVIEVGMQAELARNLRRGCRKGRAKFLDEGLLLVIIDWLVAKAKNWILGQKFFDLPVARRVETDSKIETQNFSREARFKLLNAHAVLLVIQ